MAEPAEPALVRPAQRPPPGQVERPERVPVVAAPTREHDQPVRLAASELRRAGELERRLDRLGAAGHRVDRGVRHRQVRRDLRGVPLERLGGERAAVGVREARRLVGDGVGDLAPAVADVDDDRATRGVEVLAPVGVDDGRAVGLHGDGRVAPPRRAGRRGRSPAAAHGARRTGGDGADHAPIVGSAASGAGGSSRRRAGRRRAGPPPGRGRPRTTRCWGTAAGSRAA